jgi:dihydroorotate dehydrogenase (fumarate)
MANSKLSLGKIKLRNPVMNSSGPWGSTRELLTQLNDSKSGAVVTKTFTLEPSVGNPEPNKYFAENFSINSVGLTNKGSDYFISCLKTIKKEKPIIASIFDTDPAKFLELATKVQIAGFDAIELNLSCPSLKMKEPIAYDTEALDVLLRLLFDNLSIPIGLKLPPYVTRTQIKDILRVVQKYPVNHLILINTYPFAINYFNNKPSILPNNGIGGLGGKYLKPIALAHVALFKEFAPDIPIVGVGGITSPQDVKDFLKTGATAVQIGSYLNESVSVIDELVSF